jgi:hypothetical protein
VAEHLTSKCEALSSNPVPHKKVPLSTQAFWRASQARAPVGRGAWTVWSALPGGSDKG